MATRKPVVTGMNLNIRDFTQNTGVKDKNKRKYYCGSGTLNSMLKMWGFLLNLSSIRAINKYDPVSVEFSQSAICTISSPAHVSCLSSHCTCAKKFSSVLFRFVPFVLLDAESVLTFFFFFLQKCSWRSSERSHFLVHSICTSFSPFLTWSNCPSLSR